MPTIATVFFNLNGKTAASRTSFWQPALNGVIFGKRPVINRPRTAVGGKGPGKNGPEAKKVSEMLRLLKFLFVLTVVLVVAVVAYAYLGDLSPDQEDVSEPVMLDAS